MSGILRGGWMSTVAALGTVLLSSAGPGAAEIGTTEAELYENAKAEGSIVWYEAAPLEPMQALASRFEAKYPGVKVQLLRTSGPQQYQKFMQETMAGQYIADMLLLSDAPLMKQLIADGHIAEWKIPTADRYPASFRMGDYAFAPYTTDIAIVYNTNLVSEEEAQILGSSWKGVLDPRFKGRFANVKRKCGTCYAGIHMFLDPAMADEYGPDFLQAVADQKPTLYADNPVALDRVVAGEHDFVFWLWEAIAITKHAEGAPIRWVRPSPTPEFGNSWQAISAHAPHPNAARLFHNWLLSEEGEISLQETYGARTTMEDLEDTRPATKEPWYQPIETRYDIDWDRWASDYQKDMTLWQSIQDTANQ